MTEKDNIVRSEKEISGGENKKNDNKSRKFKKNDFKKKNNKKPQYIPNYAPELMSKSVEEVGLSEQTRDILLNAGIVNLGNICSRTVKEMYGVQFFGKKQLKELSVILKKFGVDFRPDASRVTAVSQDSNQKNKEKEKSKPNKESVKEMAEASGKEKYNANEKPTITQVANNNETKDNKSRQKSKENVQKKKAKEEKFDIHDIFPREPFVPSPSIEAKPDSFIKFQRGSKWGFKDKNGKELIPPIYDEVFNFKGDYACVERKQMFGFINRENELIIPYKYDWASSFSEGYACVGNESKCGYITPEDVIVIPFIYDAGTPVIDGKAQVKQNGNWGTLDLSTKTVNWGN